MKSAVIICNGLFPKEEYPLYLIRTADYIVCCDGALPTFLRHCKRIFGKQRLPDAVVGDMDSTPDATKKKYADIIIHISEQETNDMTKAFNYVIGHYKDIDYIHFIAATGKREDHTIGNMSLLMEYARQMKGNDLPYIDMVSDWSTIFAVTDSCSIDVGQGRELSIFTPDNTLKIESEGLVWQTGGVIFDNWWKATLNRASEDRITLNFNHPSIALIVLD